MKREGKILKSWREAKVVLGGKYAAEISVVMLGICIAVSFLRMLFQNGADGYRTCFFNAIYFRSATNVNGVVSITIGLTGRYLPFLGFFLVFFAVGFGVFYITKLLLRYQWER